MPADRTALRAACAAGDPASSLQKQPGLSCTEEKRLGVFGIFFPIIAQVRVKVYMKFDGCETSLQPAPQTRKDQP